jgi:hypothetical protein
VSNRQILLRRMSMKKRRDRKKTPTGIVALKIGSSTKSPGLSKNHKLFLGISQHPSSPQTTPPRRSRSGSQGEQGSELGSEAINVPTPSPLNPNPVPLQSSLPSKQPHPSLMIPQSPPLGPQAAQTMACRAGQVSWTHFSGRIV